MAAVDLCTFSHGLGIYNHILSLAIARRKKQSNINAQPMVKWAQINGCYDLFLKHNSEEDISLNLHIELYI